MDIQELVSRGRFIFSGAPKRLEVFSLVNGRRSTQEISRKTRKSFQATLNDLRKIRDKELLQPKTDRNGNIVKKDGAILYEKTPLIRDIPLSYFRDTVKSQKKLSKKEIKHKGPRNKDLTVLRVPSGSEILDICRHGEDQIYEFKAQGADVNKISREVGAFLNTKQGGLIFYGVEDDGTIAGTDTSRQKFDQSLQNSVKHTIAPPPTISINEATILGTKILVVVVPPWDRRTVYQFDGRILIRKGTNVFIASPQEVKKLHEGVYVV